MTPREIGSALVALVVLLLIGACLAGGWWMLRPVPVIEQPAPPVVQADASVILERKPDAKARPKQIPPKGAKVERVVSVTVQPVATQGVAVAGGIKPPLTGLSEPCPPVTIDLTLVREPTGHRVIASSPDGRVTGGMDIPVESAPTHGVWAAGVSINPIHQTLGIWADRDLSRVRVGVELNQTRRTVDSPLAVEGRVKLGWVFD